NPSTSLTAATCSPDSVINCTRIGIAPNPSSLHPVPPLRGHSGTLAPARPKGDCWLAPTLVPGPTETLGYASYFLGGGLPPPKLFGSCGLHAVPGLGKSPFKVDGSKRPSLTSCP